MGESFLLLFSELFVYLTKIDGLSSGHSWNIKISKGESIENLVIGGKFIALYTSLQYIRLFSLGGTQRLVFSHPGEIQRSMFQFEFFIEVKIINSIIETRSNCRIQRY